MGKVVKANPQNSDYELPPVGNYLALVCGVYVLGSLDGPYGRKTQIVVQWELHRKRGPVRDSKGRTYTISRFYPLSLGSMGTQKSGLLTCIEGMYGRVLTSEEISEGIDLEDLVGMPCRLSVVAYKTADGKDKVKVGSIMALDEDDPKPEADFDQRYFEVTPQTTEFPTWVPPWIQAQMMLSEEWSQANGRSEPVGANSAQSKTQSKHVVHPDDEPPY